MQMSHPKIARPSLKLTNLLGNQMALHLTLEKGDRVMLSGGIVVDVRRVGKIVQLSFEAPEHIAITPIFKDAKKLSRHEQGPASG